MMDIIKKAVIGYVSIITAKQNVRQNVIIINIFSLRVNIFIF